MKLVIISDTHSLHDQMEHTIPGGDVLIHCGDISNRGSNTDICRFLEWFSLHPHKHKIFIGGNHDFGLEYRDPLIQKKLIEAKEQGITYLQDNDIIIDDIKFWGSPMTPAFYNWAFMKNRGKELIECWSNIPDDVNVLITHGPPMTTTFLDCTIRDRISVGCVDLSNRIKDLKDLKVHCFGHIHEGYGMKEHENGFALINASTCTVRYEPINKPIEIEI